MTMPAVSQEAQTIPVAKRDLIEVWSLLERMVVSNQKIGSYFAHPVGEEQSPEQHRQMNEEFMRYFGPEFFHELAKSRAALDRYLDDDEAEAISDSLNYWQPR